MTTGNIYIKYTIVYEMNGVVWFLLGVNRGWGRKWFQFYHREPFSWLDNLYTHARIVESKHFVVVRQTSMWKVVGKLLLYDLNCKMLTIPIPAANSVQHNAGHARGSQLERVASQQRRILKEEALFKIYKKKNYDLRGCGFSLFLVLHKNRERVIIILKIILNVKKKRMTIIMQPEKKNNKFSITN